MSRSRRKTPIVAMSTSVSEKQEKRMANRALRRVVNVAIKTGEEVLPVIDDGSNPWSKDKDGKVYLGSKGNEKAMRK